MSNGIYKVDRVVDTVRIEMDIDVAEQLVTILQGVKDISAHWYGESRINTLRDALIEQAEVRSPSALHRSEVCGPDFVLRDTTYDEMCATREERLGA